MSAEQKPAQMKKPGKIPGTMMGDNKPQWYDLNMTGWCFEDILNCTNLNIRLGMR